MYYIANEIYGRSEPPGESGPRGAGATTKATQPPRARTLSTTQHCTREKYIYGTGDTGERLAEK